MNPISSLEKIGFSNKKARVYLALLELGNAVPTDIAKKAQLKRTTVYNILPELLADGLVKTSVTQKKKIYFIEDTRDLLERTRAQQLVLQDVLPELAAMHNVISTKPRVRFLEGEAGVRDFFHATLEYSHPGDIIYELVGPKAFYTKLPKDIANSYVPDRMRKKIRIRIIASPSDVAAGMAKRAQQELREIKFIEGLEKEFNAAMVVYAHHVGFISFTENFTGVILESVAISRMMRTMFEKMWNAI